MSTPALAITRIQPPRPPAGCIGRGDLQDRLRAAVLGQPLVLLCAPAGFGKTTALAQLLPTLGPRTAVAWVGADADDTLVRVLAGLAAALAPLHLPWRVAPESLATLAGTPRGLREAADTLADALQAADVARGLIVLDDVHRIADTQVFALLQDLLPRLPAAWGLVLASRVDPPLGLARLRASGGLAEFRQDDLQFSAEEVERLIAAQPPMQATDLGAAALLQRTQGWAAGLRLSLAAWRSRPQGGAGSLAQRHLFDYLADEVLADMPERLRRFLLHSAPLPTLSATRAATVTGMADAAELLDLLERRGLFVSVLEATPLTLRLHDLFRDFLQARLQRDDPDALPGLLQRAAATESDLGCAVGWLARAEAWPQALGRLMEGGPALLASGGGPEIDRLLALFPRPLWDGMPDLWLLSGLSAWPRYDFDHLLLCMERAVEGYTRAGRPVEAALASAHLCAGVQHAGRFDEGTQILARLNALPLQGLPLAFVRYGAACDATVCGRADEVAPRLAEMLAALETVADPVQWQQCPLQVMLLGAPGTALQMGRHAGAILRRSANQPSALRAAALHVRCWLALLDGDLEAAAEQLQLADDDCRWLGRPRLLHTDNTLSAVLLHALRGDHGRSQAAGEALLEDLAAASPSYRRVHEPAMLFALARAAALRGNTAALHELARRMALARHPHEWPSSRGVHAAAQALLAVAQGRWDEAEAVLAALGDGLACHFMACGPHMQGLRAWVARQLGRLDLAADLLRPLLQAPPGSEAGGLLFIGAAALQGLQQTAWGSRLDSAALERLRTWSLAVRPGRQAPAPAAPPAPGMPAAPLRPVPPSPAAAPPPLQTLTPREHEVLQRLRAGDSNKLIARHLGLSEHTVKQHVASILSKLGVQTRGQAAAWARAQEGR